MSFLSDPIGNISGAVSNVGKDVAKLTSNPLVDALGGAALDYFTGGAAGIFAGGNMLDFGLGTAGNIGALTGGISALATGNLGKGLQAGLMAYTGAGLGSMIPGSEGALTASPITQAGGAGGAYCPQLPGPTAPSAIAPSSPITPSGGYSYMANPQAGLSYDEAGNVMANNPAAAGAGANNAISASTTTGTQVASDKAVSDALKTGKCAPGFFGKVGNWFTDPTVPLWEKGLAGAGTAAALKASITPQKSNAPTLNQGYIRSYTYNPYTGTSTPGPVYCAHSYLQNQPVSPNAYGASGGIVALAHGGAVRRYDGSDGSLVGAARCTPTGNPNITDQQIQQAVQAAQAQGGGGYQNIQQQMQQYNVSPDQLAHAIGANVACINKDYNQTISEQSFGAQLPAAAKCNPLSNDSKWASFMDQNGISTDQMANITGLSPSEVNARYQLVQTQNQLAAAQAAAAAAAAAGKKTDQGGCNKPAVTCTNLQKPTPIGCVTNKQTIACTASKATSCTAHKALACGIGGTTGAGQTGGGTVVNPNGTVTTSPVIAGIPVGGFTGMQQMKNAYTAGGGSTGYTLPTYCAAKFAPAVGSEQATNQAYLMGKTNTQPAMPCSSTLMKPYFASAQMKYATKLPNGVLANQQPDGSYLGEDNQKYNIDGTPFKATGSAHGGLMGLAAGGMSVGHLGGYSDGGRLLRGPGDGVSDSIPATIGAHDPEPARLADGEFVVPARIVSELGNGSTEAGARQLYKMMDRIQQARSKTTGKNAVATNTNAHKYLPA